jgi:hypothetical protein
MARLGAVQRDELRPGLDVPAGAHDALELDRLPAWPVLVTGEEPCRQSSATSPDVGLVRRLSLA